MKVIKKEQLDQLGQLLNTIQVQGQQNVLVLANIINILSNLEDGGESNG